MQFGRYYQNGKADYTSMLSSLFGSTSAKDEEILEALQELIEAYDKKEWMIAAYKKRMIGRSELQGYVF